MIALLTSLLVLMGLLVLKSKGALPSGKQPRLVLHYPASGPSPVALIALTAGSVILDRRLAELWQRRASISDRGDRDLVARIEALGATELRVGDTVGSTWTPPRPQHLPLAVKVDSADYRALVHALQARGVNDAPVVAEALLAAVHGEAIPIFATVDRELAGRLMKSESADDPYRSSTQPPPDPVIFEGRKLRLRILNET